MPYINWDASYELGHDQIDGEHLYIHQHINLLFDSVFGDPANDVPHLSGEARRERIEAAVEALQTVTAAHFTAEQALMAESDFPAMKNHAEQHAELLYELARFAEHFHSTRADSLPHAVRFLREWFEFHIDTYDRALVRWLRVGEG